jgi:hypothetical protein
MSDDPVSDPDPLLADAEEAATQVFRALGFRDEHATLFAKGIVDELSAMGPEAIEEGLGDVKTELADWDGQTPLSASAKELVDGTRTVAQSMQAYFEAMAAKPEAFLAAKARAVTLVRGT